MSYDDKPLQFYTFDAEDLKPVLKLAAEGRAQELEEAFRKVKHKLTTSMFDYAEEICNERVWWRLFIRRRKVKMPTMDQVLALTQEEFAKMYARSERARWAMAEPDPKEYMAAFGDLGIAYHIFGHEARNAWWQVNTHGMKWVREWEELAKRLEGPPPANGVQIVGEILSSMQHYAALVKDKP